MNSTISKNIVEARLQHNFNEKSIDKNQQLEAIFAQNNNRTDSLRDKLVSHSKKDDIMNNNLSSTNFRRRKFISSLTIPDQLYFKHLPKSKEKHIEVENKTTPQSKEVIKEYISSDIQFRTFKPKYTSKYHNPDSDFFNNIHHGKDIQSTNSTKFQQILRDSLICASNVASTLRLSERLPTFTDLDQLWFLLCANNISTTFNPQINFHSKRDATLQSRPILLPTIPPQERIISSTYINFPNEDIVDSNLIDTIPHFPPPIALSGSPTLEYRDDEHQSVPFDDMHFLINEDVPPEAGYVTHYTGIPLSSRVSPNINRVLGGMRINYCGYQNVRKMWSNYSWLLSPTLFARLPKDIRGSVPIQCIYGYIYEIVIRLHLLAFMIHGSQATHSTEILDQLESAIQKKQQFIQQYTKYQSNYNVIERYFSNNYNLMSFQLSSRYGLISDQDIDFLLSFLMNPETRDFFNTIHSDHIGFKDYYSFTITRSLLFLAGRTNTITNVSWTTMLSGPFTAAMNSIIKLYLTNQDPFTTFSKRSPIFMLSPQLAFNCYSTYVDLNQRCNGLISKQEFLHFRGGVLSDLTVERVFQICKTFFLSTIPDDTDNFDDSTSRNLLQNSGDHPHHESCLDYKTYVDFVLAYVNRSKEPSIRFFFKILDLDSTEKITENVLYAFYKSIMARVTELEEDLKINFQWYCSEIFDMVTPANDQYITLTDLLQCGKAHTVIGILTDVSVLDKYEHRLSNTEQDEPGL